MKRQHFLSLLIALTITTAMNAGDSYTVEKWQVLDLHFSVKKMPASPMDITFGAMIRHENGQILDVPGFYNDDRNWVIRFCPPEEGTWTYTTYASLKELTEKQGLIIVSASTKDNEHGPIVISAHDKTKLAYQDGSPYFLMAFELDWLFALDAENPNDIPRTREMVSHLTENAFNQVVMNVYAYDASWGDRASIAPEYNFAEPDVYPFLGSNQTPDHSHLNIDYFKRLDRVIAHLDSKEIIAHLMIYVWNKKVNWPDPGSKEDNMYFDYVVKRYQAFPNLVWDISKEALAYGRDDMGYITERIERLRRLDGHGRLVTVHDYGYCAAYPEKVDIISVQDWKANIYDATARIVKRHENMPVFNIEHGGYEKTMHSIFDGAYTDPLACLKRNYHIIFAGAYSTYYWQNSSWYEVVYKPFNLEKEKQPHFSYYKSMAQLFTDYDFNTLSPFHTSFHPYCLTDHKTRYLFYLMDGMISITGAMKELEGKEGIIKWFDPIKGTYFEPVSNHVKMGPWLGLRKPDEIASSFCIAILEIAE